MVRGQWRDPSSRSETLRVYAVRWVVERELSDRTRELYLGLLESLTSTSTRQRSASSALSLRLAPSWS